MFSRFEYILLLFIYKREILWKYFLNYFQRISSRKRNVTFFGSVLLIAARSTWPIALQEQTIIDTIGRK